MTKPSTPTTTIVHRPFGQEMGYRRVTDRASRVAVHAFPMTELAAVSAAGVLATPGCYVMTDGKVVYIGESRRPERRLSDHASDRNKTFAQNVFVIAGHGDPFDKILGLDLQYKLTSLAVKTRAVAVMKGLNPSEPDMSDDDRATHNRIATDALRLLFDAGCTIFQPTAGISDEEAEAAPAFQERGAAADGGEAADSGPMAIGVPTIGHEYELRYCGLWSRGYPSGGRFIVAPGSEVRAQTNGSVDDLTRRRRQELFRADVLEEIPGAADRRRLTVAVAFATQSIAAKVVCGAHSAPRWTPLAARAVVLAT
ncbi:GIY-YIG nuclease family protein [Bradyrhizobium sp. CW4]|uniref:GIY-YIG nuclease family protein n=1 Tax=Bradyrhizobium sp. CW4 TaxID=2782687 RepID=UPI001FF939BF|nr:GIY-YIG nuclease family protein [Bradyrhizobium sp. CW4]MCK1417612.1 GIY-YIG nuclease family protein [Bradyrhizobium sp. CW4]